MICEYCGKEHDGHYGSGRFCDVHCSKSFSSNIKRAIINQKNKDYYRRKRIEEYGTDIDRKHFERQQRNKQKHQEYINRINEIERSDDWEYITYQQYDFNKLYAINKNGQVINIKTGKMLKSIKQTNNGYCFYVLSIGNHKQVEVSAHRLVATIFIPNPCNYPCINHKDENKSNNSIDNLEWCTWSYNCTYNQKHINNGLKLRGRHLSEEHKKHLSESLKNFYNSKKQT